jgi:hypothetical protein
MAGIPGFKNPGYALLPPARKASRFPGGFFSRQVAARESGTVT